MAQVATDQKLRDMAEHRGLKLVKSRRRKPGVGDYGKFGLIDAAGKPLLGIGAQGLEASAQDIEAYLRAGAARLVIAFAAAFLLPFLSYCFRFLKTYIFFIWNTANPYSICHD